MNTDSIRAIARAMLLLRTLNMRLESSLHSLHLQTGLPKPTIFRILRTLMLEGYVHSVGDGGHYRLTSKVEELAAGYTEKSAVVDVGSPVVLSLTREIQWPLAIGTLDGDAIVVRYSTMPYSPVAVHATTLGQRLGLLDTAMGRGYLAFCPSNERTKLLHLLRNLVGGQEVVGIEPLDVSALAKMQRHVSGGARPPVLLRDHLYRRSLKPSRDG